MIDCALSKYLLRGKSLNMVSNRFSIRKKAHTTLDMSCQKKTGIFPLNLDFIRTRSKCVEKLISLPGRWHVTLCKVRLVVHVSLSLRQ